PVASISYNSRVQFPMRRIVHAVSHALMLSNGPYVARPGRERLCNVTLRCVRKFSGSAGRIAWAVDVGVYHHFLHIGGLPTMKFKTVPGVTATLVAAGIALTACTDSSGAQTDAWPDSNLEVLIGFGAGGTPDLLGRGVGDQLQDEHDINVTATNRPGGASTIAMNEALSSQADGTTLALATSNGLLWQPLVEDGLEYDQTEGYEVLAKVAESPFSLMVASDSEFATMQDFIEAADSGAELSVAVTGEGAQTDLTVQQLNEQNDWNLRSVPYTDGAGEGILAVMRGEVDAQVSTTAGVQGKINSEDVKIL